MRDLTQDELANAIGVSKDTVASWETGRKNPNPKSLSLLARFFGITEDYLSCKTDFPTNADYSDVTTWGGSNVQLAVKFAKEFDLLSVESRLEVMALIIDLREREERQKSYEVEQRVADYKTKSKRKKEDYREELWEQHIDEELRPAQEGKAKK